MRIVLGAFFLLAAGAWLSYAYRYDRVWLWRIDRVWLWRILGLIALVLAVWFGFILRDANRYMAGMEDERRRSHAGSLGMELRRTMTSTNLDGISREFTADLASIVEGSAWEYVDRPRRGDGRGCVSVVITNDLGQALVMLLQDEYASEGWKFRLLSYKKTTQPVAAPNGGPTPSVTNSGVTGGRHR
jgi:hypothetical protein